MKSRTFTVSYNNAQSKETLRTLAALKHPILRGIRNVIVAPNTVKDVLAVVRGVGARGVARLEAEAASTCRWRLANVHTDLGSVRGKGRGGHP